MRRPLISSTLASSGRHGPLVVACALVLLAGPALGTAHADPERPGAGGAGTGADSGSTSGSDSGKGSESGSGSGAGSGERGGGPNLEEIRKEIERLHDKAESATDAYNAAESATKKQRKRIVALAKRIDTAQGKLDTLHDTAGAMARAQYRSGGVPPAAKLMLGDDPEDFLRGLSLTHKGQQATRSFIGTLTETRSRLRGDAKDASDAWQKLEKTRKKKAAAKKKVNGRLKQAKKIETGLKAEERERLRELQDEAAEAKQAKWLKSGVLDGLDGKASPAGRRAIEWATKQLGKDYVWGAEGPDTFDCSGLTMRAWEAAGVRIPRTSQEQWKQLPHVPVGSMRPGDLIIYKKDASHVGIYVGDGALLHAPRTGRQITVEGAGSMPILGVVRPDK
ncbi:NlpC/P60 family protein [Streptomyces diacarni]|uniref:C40 family peptidase n=1 Tax=Streptomyces diacarni TaxID=2800381 RepID=UPI001FEB1C55|nr:C40 family peptidase [Streptomyces diacarni]